MLRDPFCLAEHFVFPDDQLAEDQNEVKTIEEESLVCVAYPELVERYVRDKARAEENKANSKNTTCNDLELRGIFFEHTLDEPPTLRAHTDQRRLVFQKCLLQQLWRAEKARFSGSTTSHQRLWCRPEVSLTVSAVTYNRSYLALTASHRCCRSHGKKQTEQHLSKVGIVLVPQTQFYGPPAPQYISM